VLCGAGGSMPTPKHGYPPLPDGTIPPSVTQIGSRFMDKSALIPWGYKRGKLGLELYSKDPLEIGTAVHAMVECSTRGGSDQECIALMEETVKPEHLRAAAMKSFAGFKEWFIGQEIEIVATEIQLVSQKHRFGGTPDMIGVFTKTGTRALFDYKTGSDTYTDHKVQVGAYKYLWEENFPDRPLTGAHLVLFNKVSGGFSHHYFPDDVLAIGWGQFLRFRECYDVDKQLAKM